MNKMKTSNYFSIFCVVILWVVSGCADNSVPIEVTNPIFVNRTSLNMYVGDEMQLTASPVGENFIWSSENEDVVSVSQTGLIKAVGEGSSSITVELDNDEVRIDVRVRTFIPLTDINLTKTSMKLYVGDVMQVEAYSVPENASDITFTWRSENPNIATVNKKGIITGVSRGITQIIVSYGSIEKSITVSVPEFYMFDKTGWTVTVSGEKTSDGGGKDRMIDGSYTSGHWHSPYSPDPNPAFPYWAIIDMKEQVDIGRIVTLRRSNGDTKTLQYFVSDSPDVNSDTWVKITEGAYASASANHSLTLDVVEPVVGRYLKLVLPDSFRSIYIAIVEVDVYGVMY
jgi:hypothetical protein